MALLNYSPPVDPYLSIIYCDDDICVLEKPSGLLSVPGKAPEHKDSLINRVNTVFPSASVVHRLDMATSGIMIIAMNKASHRNISKQFELRAVKKTYYALVHGQFENLEGQIDLPLRCDWPNRPKQMIDHESGKQASTLYRRVTQFDDFAMIELKPITGRSHQLRVHMLAHGHPILGDRLYATGAALEMSPRLCLHASTIEFEHPTTQKIIKFESSPNFPEI